MPSEPRTLRWTKRHGDECFACRNSAGHGRYERVSKATGDWRDPKWKVNPETRSMAYLREQGWTPWVVERRKGPVSVDLFNFGDILAMRVNRPKNPRLQSVTLGGDLLIVQATTGSNVNARIRKVLAEPMAKEWLECEGMIAVHGWRRLKRGGDRMEATVREILLEDFDK